jgi:hypothetical protein
MSSEDTHADPSVPTSTPATERPGATRRRWADWAFAVGATVRSGFMSDGQGKICVKPKTVGAEQDRWGSGVDLSD